jgi:hypothetical protein
LMHSIILSEALFGLSREMFKLQVIKPKNN